MHTIKITPNLLFEYQCTSGKFIRLPNRIESKLFCPNWNALARDAGDIDGLLHHRRSAAGAPQQRRAIQTQACFSYISLFYDTIHCKLAANYREMWHDVDGSTSLTAVYALPMHV